MELVVGVLMSKSEYVWQGETWRCGRWGCVC